MLVVSRREQERIMIGDNIVITLVETDRGKARIGIQAPDDVEIYREELLDRETQNRIDQNSKRRKS